MNTKKIIIILLVGNLILIGISSLGFGKSNLADKKSVAKKNEPVKSRDLKAAVAAHLNLPSDEEPTIANISDANKVKNEIFFKNAKNGDKVLIYSKAQKAILYRPSEDKIIEVASLSIKPEGPVSAPTTEPIPSPTVEVTPTVTP